MSDRELSEHEIGSTEELANTVLGQAIRERASDIHIDPVENGMRIRYRIDGYLQERWTLPNYKLDLFINRLKVISNLDITNKVIPQDGSFELTVKLPKTDKDPEEERLVAARISFFHTVKGEAAVLRLLNRSEMVIPLEETGMDPETLVKCRELFGKSYGMVLVTGPSGSGKTTTLYSALQEIRSKDKNIITLEDPVEYHFDGIRQVQILPEQGLTFAVGMKSILRQDPDVIMIGEIRDPETAEYAIRAALVGRLVFSTVHANTAIGTIARLIDMNIERSLIAYAMNGVIAKRLVRKICPSCTAPYEPDPNILKYFNLDPAGRQFVHGAGCDACNGTGYFNRVSLFEVLEFDGHLRALIMEKAPINELEEFAERSGLKTLKQDAIEKVLAGVTTIEEAARAV
ncbi:MAG TPA: GspE/PulE family protein [Candidatus Paceibacterota bacterium]|nr:GspE/PulE family protein [Candidatus Paceibacterota bacterium]